MKTQSHSKQLVISAAVAALAGIVLLAGCKTPIQSREVSTVGFLDDYSLLKEGESGQAKLLYTNPSADFASYNKIFIEPITVWVEDDSELAKLPEDELQALVNYLDATLRENLKKDYTLVDQAGSGVMRLRLAITEGTKASVALNTLSSIVPVGVAVNAAKRGATGTNAAVGEAAIEGELTDSLSGELLMAAVDARSGRKIIASGNFTRWGDVKDAFDYWAENLAARLAELRAR